MKDRGSFTVEFAGLLPGFLVVLLICLEAYITNMSVEQLENATRTGARSESMRAGTGQAAAEKALPSWLNEHSVEVGSAGEHAVFCRITAKVPVIAPGIPFDFTVERRVEMPVG